MTMEAPIRKVVQIEDSPLQFEGPCTIVTEVKIRIGFIENLVLNANKTRRHQLST